MNAQQNNLVIDPKVVEFLVALADLMQQYDVTFDVQEEHCNYEVRAAGIDIDVSVSRDHKWQGQQFVEIRSTYINHTDIRKTIRGSD